MGGDNNLIHAWNACFQHNDEVEVFFRRRVADGIGDVDGCGASADRGFNHAAEVIVLGARRVHRTPFDIICVAACARNGRDDALEHLLLVELELKFAMQGRRADEGVDTPALCRLDGFARAVDVAEAGARQAANHRMFGEFGNFVDGFEIAVRGDRKACFDDIDAHLVEQFGDLEFLFERHRRAGALFAVAQRGVEDDDLVGGTCFRIIGIRGHRS